MLSIFLALALGGAGYAGARALPSTRGSAIPTALLVGYVLRLFLSIVVRNVPFFAHGLGGDSRLYEDYARLIARMWETTGVHFVDDSELPVLGATTLPPNIFGLVFYLSGDLGTLGCVSIVAFSAQLLFLNMYSLAVEQGAPRDDAQLLTLLLYFSPLVLFYTSDTYKDGLVASLTFGGVASAVRLSRRFSIAQVLVGGACIWALWHVRFYLVFVAVAPLGVGLVGLTSSSLLRPMLVALALLIGVLALAAYSDVLQSATERASETFANGTAQNVLDANARTGSGVTFDDGGQPFGAFGPKLAYTLFSPFPWSGGSLGFQIGKVDAFIWYYILYRSVRSIRRATAQQRGFILMLLTFLIPCIVMYATSVSNVGLIVRQRLVIVLTTSVIAMLVGRRDTAPTDVEPAQLAETA